ncbi:hypothetical protein PF005_g6459 [Phytophthora fragariae]|uniref:Uncharacterized protein n=1 Tax=Phytophthora fragariae TaxID=53985 RepID=A0A6A3T136_9STRA|nr:hypothetical protein PF003_g26905 [Phytophthora fragariae]KAE8942882.1 hypothetical protein PF009_g7378 [Phytophthora fragariae]KAE9020166.1 hypothetical protein PF011_g5535 [Phytophthora fragariae]KAE9125282.1 hypothetical protein PF007_g6408 [Phytophthora fragariae]KAE9147932.1 hypothetical protein PF006_g7434 [Phytophthora fragariae]
MFFRHSTYASTRASSCSCLSLSLYTAMCCQSATGMKKKKRTRGESPSGVGPKGSFLKSG